MTAASEAWRRGITAHLLALHDAARLNLTPRHVLAGATTQQIAELERPGPELYQALLSPNRRTPWRCPNTRKPGKQGRAHHPDLLEVNDRRLVVIPTGRPPRFPSGWRPESWLVLDLQLLAQEGHQGFHLRCPHCANTHSFTARALRTHTGNPLAAPGEPSSPPSQYPSVAQAALLELIGPYSNLEAELSKDTPELYLYLAPDRAERFEAATAGVRGQQVPPVLLVGPRIRVIHDNGPLTWPGLSHPRGFRISEVDPGRPPAPLPSTPRLDNAPPVPACDQEVVPCMARNLSR